MLQTSTIFRKDEVLDIERRVALLEKEKAILEQIGKLWTVYPIEEKARIDELRKLDRVNTFRALSIHRKYSPMVID